MAKTELKTKKTEASVSDFLNAIPDAQRRADCQTVSDLMSKATKDAPKMYGSSIVGFGSTTITYADGRTMEWMQIGFSPRKAALTLYLNSTFDEYEALAAKLGKHTRGKGCLYINSLADMHLPTLRQMIKLSLAHQKSKKASE